MASSLFGLLGIYGLLQIIMAILSCENSEQGNGAELGQVSDTHQYQSKDVFELGGLATARAVNHRLLASKPGVRLNQMAIRLLIGNRGELNELDPCNTKALAYSGNDRAA